MNQRGRRRGRPSPDAESAGTCLRASRGNAKGNGKGNAKDNGKGNGKGNATGNKKCLCGPVHRGACTSRRLLPSRTTPFPLAVST